ncbi:MAG: HAMP domain-containing histidine kinase [Nitrospinae bacterium]|nr:HAMP domain-containing histidine kinase [Nitrospinota bacterium]
MLKSGGADPDRVALLAGVVKRSADNIYGLIEDIFDFVKSGHTHLRKERQPLEPLLEALAYQAKSIAPAKVETLLAAEPGLALSLDRRRLSRALFNLIKNAIEAMPTGGVLSLSARRAADTVEIEVADTGVGIEPERLERIWDQFYTHGKAQGTGLGMAIVKKIVEDHGWRVAARSTLGQGTAFTITAPAEE